MVSSKQSGVITPENASRKNGQNLKIWQQDTAQKTTDFCSTSPPVLMSNRDDWKGFRDINRLPGLAGVKRDLLPRVVVKELVDNAYDAANAKLGTNVEVEFGLLPPTEPGEVRFFVHDYGDGINKTDADVAALYSFGRPMTSSKTFREPTLGMLGNGLRVVAGFVSCCGGELIVSTQGRALALAPQDDGTTKIVRRGDWDGKGTRIEIAVRGSLAEFAEPKRGLFDWAEMARSLAKATAAHGKRYAGRTSPWMHDSVSFWEMLQSVRDTSVERLLAEKFDGCSDRKRAEEIAENLLGRTCETITRDESRLLLERARAATKPVTAERLGKVGRREDYLGYAINYGEFERDGAKVPFVVEVWANKSDKPEIDVCVNRTPIVTKMSSWRHEDDYRLSGSGINTRFQIGQQRCGEYRLLLNVITPFVPLTSSGKDPDLSPMLGQILEACGKAVRVAKRKTPKIKGKKVTQKSVILSHLEEAAKKLSGNGIYYFSLRQLFYHLRPYLIQVIGREPRYGTFSRIIGTYEDAKGDIEHLYRDDRGRFYHPHTGEWMSLGTRSVAKYKRPQWLFNKILYSEKEGLFPVLISAKWPERHDCALATSKGYTTRAARELIRLVKATGEPVVVYCIHDADGPGTWIYESFARELKKHGIEVVNLGLEPAEGRSMGLPSEPVQKKGNKLVPVAKYVSEQDRKWLQKNRIELNAMDSPQFIDWLDRKMELHDRARKIVPPAEVVHMSFEEATRAELSRQITEEILRTANIPAKVAAIIGLHKAEVSAASQQMVTDLPRSLSDDPVNHWSKVVKDVAIELAKKVA